MARITIAQKIKQLREMRGVSQEELADKLAVSVGTIRNWERGVGEPTMTYAEEISRILNVDILQLHNEEVKIKDDYSKIIEQGDAGLDKEITLKKTKKVHKWLDEHPKQRFKIGFNRISTVLQDDCFIGKTYDLELIPNALDIPCLMLAIDALYRKNYLITGGSIGLPPYSFMTVFLRDAKEAEQFTYDLAAELCISAVFRSERERNLFRNACDALSDCSRKLGDLMNNAFFDAELPKYSLVLRFDDGNEHAFANTEKRVVEIIESSKPKCFEIASLNNDGSGFEGRDIKESAALYQELKKKI